MFSAVPAPLADRTRGREGEPNERSVLDDPSVRFARRFARFLLDARTVNRLGSTVRADVVPGEVAAAVTRCPAARPRPPWRPSRSLPKRGGRTAEVRSGAMPYL